MIGDDDLEVGGDLLELASGQVLAALVEDLPERALRWAHVVEALVEAPTAAQDGLDGTGGTSPPSERPGPSRGDPGPTRG